MKTKFKLTIAYAVFFVILIAASSLIIMSPMMLDAPGSEDSIIIWVILFALWTYLPVFLASLIGSLILYKKKKESASVVFSMLPLINIVVVSFGMFLNYN